MQRGLATRLHELSTDFRKMQVRSEGARLRCKERAVLRIELFCWRCSVTTPLLLLTWTLWWLQKSYVGDLRAMASKTSIESLIGGVDAGGAVSSLLVLHSILRYDPCLSLVVFLSRNFQAEDTDEGMTDEQMSEMAHMQEDADERVREIQVRTHAARSWSCVLVHPHPFPVLQRIARSVEQLAVLFRELNTLIVEQGTMLDRIDHNMETVRSFNRRCLLRAC
jgi:hypothetical protein